MELFSNEAVYDNEISPLVLRIVAICKEHGIPMVASFTYENCSDEGPGRCTTIVNVPARFDDINQRAHAVLMGEGMGSFIIGITSGES